MRQLYTICRSKRKVWKEFPNGRHNESILEPGYFETIANFVIDEVLEKSSETGEEKSSPLLETSSKASSRSSRVSNQSREMPEMASKSSEKAHDR